MSTVYFFIFALRNEKLTVVPISQFLMWKPSLKAVILKIQKGKGIITDKCILQKWAVWLRTASNWLRVWSSVRNIVIGSVQWLSAECWAFAIDSQRYFGCVTSVINLLHQRQFNVRHHQYNIDCKQTTRALFVDKTDFVTQGEWVNMNQWI